MNDSLEKSLFRAAYNEWEPQLQHYVVNQIVASKIAMPALKVHSVFSVKRWTEAVPWETPEKIQQPESSLLTPKKFWTSSLHKVDRGGVSALVWSWKMKLEPGIPLRHFLLHLHNLFFFFLVFDSFVESVPKAEDL